MGLLREINLAGNTSQVQNFVAGDNITFAPQSDGTIRIDGEAGGQGGCTSYSMGWDADDNSITLTSSESAVAQSLPVEFKVLRVENGNSYFEVDTVNGTVSMSADIKAAFNAALA